MIHPDYVIVGAGLSGAVMAERLANDLNKKVFIIEKRGYLGGNCSDYIDEYGVLCHRFGGHVFHTDNEEVFKYLSQFTGWYNPKLKFNVKIEDKFVPLPFNLNSLHQTHTSMESLFLEGDLFDEYGDDEIITIKELRSNSRFKELANYIYKHVFEGYNLKMWGMAPEEVPSEIIDRLPVRLGYNNNYFPDQYQGVPTEGYTAMFERMLESDNIDILLNTDYKEILSEREGQLYFNGERYKGHVIFTGRIDEWYNYCYGVLPYRTLDFQHQTVEGVSLIHPVALTSYPSDYDFIRVCEFKHITGQKCDDTTLCFEYPHPYRIGGGFEPLYPIPVKENKLIYEKYRRMAHHEKDISFLGRLGRYDYINMDEAVEDALELYMELV